MNQTNNKVEEQIIDHLSIYMDDPKLNVWHLALLAAILSLGIRQGETKRIKVSRSKLMQLSHINTLPTYHKYFKQLQELGYIKYSASYHPGYKSEVEINENSLSQEF
ncbi:hypothetical protein [Flavobacterium sp. FlaQc-47]|uniref:hypothetical protein n=1 Tax=Flavobacterium sp. FlaQc-47 TaxID=3374180 RepID=UPI00375711F0